MPVLEIPHHPEEASEFRHFDVFTWRTYTHTHMRRERAYLFAVAMVPPTHEQMHKRYGAGLEKNGGYLQLGFSASFPQLPDFGVEHGRQ